MVLAVEDCVQFREEVQTTLDDLVQGQKEAQVEVTKILDCPTHREAQQLLLIHQVLWETLHIFFFLLSKFAPKDLIVLFSFLSACSNCQSG